MPSYRTAQGKVLDMSQLAAKNERTRAVGNMNVNARGDTIDSFGNIIVPVTKKVGDKYQRSVTNRAGNVTKRSSERVRTETQEATTIPDPIPAKNPVVQPPVVEENAVEVELLEEEMEFENTDDEDAEIEAIKAAEAPAFVVKPASEAPDFVKPETTKKK